MIFYILYKITIGKLVTNNVLFQAIYIPMGEKLLWVEMLGMTFSINF
jgi:hypothetical protein